MGKTKGAKVKPKTRKKRKFEDGVGPNKNVVKRNVEKKPKSEIQQLEEHVLKYIVGQDEQVRQIITAIYRAKVFESIKSNVLVIGNSGTGKTATIKQIAEKMDIPYTIEDATQYTQEGYYGASVDDMIYNLLLAADLDEERAERGLIVIDEIDKKTANEDAHDVAGVEVLKSLLKMIEGKTVSIDMFGYTTREDAPIIEFDTKNIIIIFLGAFPGLDMIKRKRLNLDTLGFASNFPKTADEKKAKVLKQDLIQYGMPEEFVGRIDTIIEMNNLSQSDLVTILKKSRLSIFRKYEKEFKKQGVKLYYDDRLFEHIAEVSLALDTGARELSNTVNYIFQGITYDVLANPGKYTSCKLLSGIVEDNTKYVIA